MLDLLPRLLMMVLPFFTFEDLAVESISISRENAEWSVKCAVDVALRAARPQE